MSYADQRARRRNRGISCPLARAAAFYLDTEYRAESCFPSGLRPLTPRLPRSRAATSCLSRRLTHLLMSLRER